MNQFPLRGDQRATDLGKMPRIRLNVQRKSWGILVRIKHVWSWSRSMRRVSLLLSLAVLPVLAHAPARAQEPAAAAAASATTAAAVVSTTDAAKLPPSPQPVAPVASAPERPAPPRPPVTRLVATIDLTNQRMTVAVDGQTAHVWAISSGRAGYLTPTGSFRPQWASRMHYSRKYDLAPMPYSVFFNGGIATHGTGAVGMLGQPASHGCIRLTTANAATFYNLVHRYGFAATRIHVRGQTPVAAPAIARRRTFDKPRVARHDRTPPVRVVAPRPVPPRYAYQPPRVVYTYPAPGYGYGSSYGRQAYVVRPQPKYLFSNW